MKLQIMGLILGLVCLVGCKSSNTFGLNPDRVGETRSAILSTINDSDRSADMLAIVDAMEAEVNTIGAEALEIRQRIVEANRDYDTTRADLEQLYADLGTLIERLGVTLKKHSMQLREHCTKAEWREINSDDSKAFTFSY
jgi:hypothetical protein